MHINMEKSLKLQLNIDNDNTCNMFVLFLLCHARNVKLCITN